MNITSNLLWCSRTARQNIYSHRFPNERIPRHVKCCSYFSLPVLIMRANKIPNESNTWYYIIYDIYLVNEEALLKFVENSYALDLALSWKLQVFLFFRDLVMYHVMIDLLFVTHFGTTDVNQRNETSWWSNFGQNWCKYVQSVVTNRIISSKIYPASPVHCSARVIQNS